jgi:uncharacterized membrane protein YjgN (DUF898 family)
MTDAVLSPPPPAGPAASPVTFTGVRGDFRRLITRGAMLELITLGFYRFWLATDMRRHFWSHTSVEGDTPEYTGTAKELLIGFLIALAILVPIYLAYFLVGLELERVKVFASIPLVLFVYLFFQFAIYRARRYRLSRTIWRGVRFWMRGSGWAYALRAGFGLLPVLVTAGLAWPWYQAMLERYKMRHSFYGDLQGRFDGAGWGLFKSVWWLWLPFLPIVLLIYGALLVGLWILVQREAGMNVINHILPIASALKHPAISTGYFTLLSLWGVFGYAIYKAHEWRWWVSGIRFGDVSFESKLPAIALVDLYWTVIGWSWLIMIVLFVWFFAVFGLTYLYLYLYLYVSSGSAGSEAFAAIAQNPVAMGIVVFAFVLGYLACALTIAVVMRMYLRRDVWARVVHSSVVLNLAAADSVAARGEAASALGEGFADSFDIGGF